MTFKSQSPSELQIFVFSISRSSDASKSITKRPLDVALKFECSRCFPRGISVRRTPGNTERTARAVFKAKTNTNRKTRTTRAFEFYFDVECNDHALAFYAHGSRDKTWIACNCFTRDNMHMYINYYVALRLYESLEGPLQNNDGRRRSSGRNNYSTF